MAKRVPWRRVKAKALTLHNQRLYERYAQAFESADKLGRQLRQCVSVEWNNKYPDGIDGQICIFNAAGGALMYAMKDITTLEENAKKAFDADCGDDVFSRPSAGATSGLAEVNAETDERDPLLVISESLRHALSESAENEEQESSGPQRAAESNFSQRLRGNG